jgi:glycosyltransferase involved in cell wall biosynthesis
MPAYNAAETPRDQVRRIREGVDRVILVDDGSQDETVEIARHNQGRPAAWYGSG